MKRDTYIAVCNVSGEWAASPAAFDNSVIFGPYTARQAAKAETLKSEIPDETIAIITFKVDGRPPFPALMQSLREKVRLAKEIDADEKSRHGMQFQ